MLSRRTAALALLVAGLVGTAAGALAQHHRRHRHGHGHHDDAAPPDAGAATANVTETADAGAPTHGPTRGPTQGEAACTPRTYTSHAATGPDTARYCESDRDCQLAQAACCKHCGVVREEDVVAVSATAADQWVAGLCGPDDRCQTCSNEPNPTLSAVCLSERCEVRVHETCGR